MAAAGAAEHRGGGAGGPERTASTQRPVSAAAARAAAGSRRTASIAAAVPGRWLKSAPRLRRQPRTASPKPRYMRTRRPSARRKPVRKPPARRRAATATSSIGAARTDSKPPQASQASRRRRMNWPLATAGPAPSAAASQSPRRASSRAKTGGDQEVLAQAAHLLEAGQGDRVQPPLGRRGVRPRQQVRRVAGVGVGREEPGGLGAPRRPPRARGPSPASPRGRGPAARSDRRGSAGGPRRDQAGGAVRRAVVDHPHRGGAPSARAASPRSPPR